MKEFVDKVPLKGMFEFWIYRRGIIVEKFAEHNLIVNGAGDQMAHLLAGEVAGRSVTKIAFGTSGAEPDVANTTITDQFVKPISGFVYPESRKVQFDWVLLETENNGIAISEFGLLTDAGTLFARKTRANPIYKEADISIEGHWTIIF